MFRSFGSSLSLLFILLLPLCLGGEEFSDDLLVEDNFREKVRSELQSRNYLKAFEYLERAQFQKGSDKDLLSQQSRLIEKSEKQLASELSKSPADYFLHYLSAKMLFLKGDLALSLKILHRSLDLNGRYVEALNLKGWIQFRQGHYFDSLATYERILIIEPTNEKIYKNFQTVFYRANYKQEKIPLVLPESDLSVKIPKFSPSKTTLYLIDDPAKLPFSDISGADDLEQNLERVNLVLYEEKKDREREIEKKPTKIVKDIYDENSFENQSEQGEKLSFEGEVFVQNRGAIGDFTPLENIESVVARDFSIFQESCDALGSDFRQFEKIEVIYQRIKKLDPQLKYLRNEFPEAPEILETRYSNARSTYEVGQDLDKAKKIFFSVSENRFKEVLPLSQKALKFSQNQFFEALYFFGISQSELGNSDAAIKALEKLKQRKEFLDLGTNERLTKAMKIDLYRTLVQLHKQKGDYAQSWDVLSEMIHRYPSSAKSLPDYTMIKWTAFFFKYLVLFILGITLFLFLVLYFVIIPFATYIFGRLFMNQENRIREIMAVGDYSKAALQLEKILVKTSGMKAGRKLVFWELLLECRFRIGHFDKVKDEGREYLDEYPDSGILLKYYCKALFKLGDESVETVVLYKKYLADEPQDREVLRFAAPLFLSHAIDDITITLFEEFFRFNKANNEINSILSNHYFEIKKLNKETLKVFQTVLESEPGSFEVQMAVFKCYEKLGMSAEIINESKPVLAKGVDDLNLHLVVISAYKTINMLEEAVLLYRDLNQKFPDNKVILDILGGLELEFENEQSKFLDEDEVTRPRNKIIIDDSFEIPLDVIPISDPYLIQHDLMDEDSEKPLVSDPFYQNYFEKLESAVASMDQNTHYEVATVPTESSMEEALLLQTGDDLSDTGEDFLADLPTENPPLFIPEEGQLPSSLFEDDTEDLSELMPDPQEGDILGLQTSDELLTADLGEDFFSARGSEVERLLDEGDYEKAMAQILSEKERHPSDLTLDRKLLTCYVKQKDFESASTIYKRINWSEKQMNQRTKDSLYDLGSSLQAGEDFKGALDIFTQILNNDIGYRDSFDRYEALLSKVS